MKNFNYINRESINPVDLNVLGRTYDTLEQGHHEAVKAASDLEVTMANLPLNEAEAGFRQQKIAEIKQLVADNTNHGNAYGALDKIIMDAGNIASDPGMIGRLQAQKDFTAFRDNLDKRQDLPQDYKDYYKQANPYQYQDQVDDKTGQIIGGSKWEPNTSPTQVVPLNQVIDQGLKWAAKQSGGGDVTRWIDSTGAITKDPSKAFDGQVYNNTSNKWESLSKEKIRQGIQASIAATSGAKESLDQDYNIALWKHRKQMDAIGDGKPIPGDVTDKNGVELSSDLYLKKRIDPAVFSNSYTNSISNTNYGQGLVTYKAAAKAAAAASTNSNTIEKAMIDGRDTPVNVPIDAASTFVSTKNVASIQLKDLYKKITGTDLVVDGNSTIGNMEQLLTNHDVPVTARQQIRSLVKSYNEGVSNFKAYTDKMSPSDKADFDFSARIKSGGELKSSANGGSKYDDKIITEINKLYGSSGQTLEIDLSDDRIRTEFLNRINGGQFGGYKNLGISVDNNKITIPKTAMHSMPLVFDALEKAKNGLKDTRDQTDSFFDKLIKPYSNYSIKALDKNNQETNYSGASNGNIFTTYAKGTLSGRNIADTYNKAAEIGTNLSNKYKLQNDAIQLSSLNLDGSNFTEGTLFDQYNKGIIDEKGYKLQKQYYDDSFNKILSNTDFSQTDMYYLADGDNVKRRVIDGTERFNYGSEILKAVKDKRVTVTPSIVPGINDPVSGAPVAGYNITVLPEKNNGKNVSSAPKRFYLPGLVNETASQYMMQDPTVQAFNTISVVGGTKSTKSLTDNNVNPKLGNISITGLGNNNFELNYNGIKKSIRQEDAVKITTALNNYNAVKDRFMAESHNQSEYKLTDPRMKSTIADAAIKIGNVIGANPSAVLEKLVDDINK